MTIGQPDPDVVRRHLAALREVLANLRKHAGRTAPELRADPDLRWIIERGLQLGVQNALDIATHLAAASGLDAPVQRVMAEGLQDLEDFARHVEAYLARRAGG